MLKMERIPDSGPSEDYAVFSPASAAHECRGFLDSVALGVLIVLPSCLLISILYAREARQRSH
jgi:hypothetical protein